MKSGEVKLVSWTQTLQIQNNSISDIIGQIVLKIDTRGENVYT
jgi:hypothetical protein